MALFHALATLCLFGNALAQVPGLGGCPDVETVPDFDVTKYLGIWYEAHRYFAIFELGAKCVQANYTAGENNTVVVVNSQINSFTGNPGSIRGIARTPNATEPAKLKVKFDSVPVEGNYWVLATDYKTYAVVYSCDSLKFLNFKYAWILTREQNPPESVIATALEIAEKNHLNKKWFLQTDQKDCDEKSSDLQ